MIGEDTDRSRASGTIAYIVLEGDTTHVMSGATVYAMKTEREVSGNPRTLSIPGGDTAVATQSSMYGRDGSWALTRSVSGSSMSVEVDEDTIGDTGRGHTTEAVSIIVGFA